MAPIIPDPKKIKSFRERGGVRSLAAREPRPRDGAVAEDSQEGLRPADGDLRAGAGRGAVLGMDRRHPQGVRRALVPAAVHAAQGEEHLEPDQPRPRRPADGGRPHDCRTASGRSTPRRRMAAGTPPMRRSAARPRPRSPTIFAPPSRRIPRARKTFRTLGRQNLFALAFRTNNMKTPAGRARKIAALVAMLARGETIVPQAKGAGRRGGKRTPR